MLTVKDVLKLDCLKNSRLVGGQNNRNNIIQSVNVMDAPDIVKWVKENEFLLTTGYAINNNKDYINSLIKGLKDKGCAALGIKTKRYFDVIPNYIIDIANQYDFPLIELPYDIAFSQIITHIVQKTFDKEENDTDIKRLIDEGLEQQNVSNVIKVLSQTLEQPITLESIYLDEPISYSLGKQSKVLLNIVEDNNILQQLSQINRTYVNNKSFKLEVLSSNDNFKERNVFPIKFRTKTIGYFSVWGQKNKALSYKDDKVIQYGLSLITFLLKEKRAQTIINKKLKIKIINDLINYKPDIQRKLYKQAEYAGISLKDNYIVMTASNPHYTSDRTEVEEMYFSDIIFKLDKYLNDYLDVHPLIGQYKEKVVLILYDMNNNKTHYVEKILKFMGSNNDLTPLTEDFVVGISNECNGMEAIKRAYHESLKAIELAKERAAKIMKYKELGIIGLIFKPEQGMDLNAIIDFTIRPILNSQECEGKLYATLHAYFNNNESLTETSKELFLHRNSLKYRLDRLQQVLALDINNTEDKFKMYLGVKAYELLTGAE